jgi:predicted ATPase
MITIEQTCNHDNFFVLTGGPGVGKTTLLGELEKKKFKCVPEVAREIIKEQMKIEGEGIAMEKQRVV